MKAIFSKIRFSRKLVLSLGCVLLIGGASGVAAVFVGTERLLGPSWESVNGLTCTTVQTVAIRKNGVFWIRKFVRTQGGDGPARMRTAIRVANTIQQRDKPDLIQVSVLDSKGPQIRSEMRGRAIAAQVVHIADLAKVPEGADGRSFTAFYLDGAPNADGQFYGLKMDLPLEDIQAISASITDGADCVDPNPVVDPHAKPASHGSDKKKSGGKKGEHGATDAHGAPEASHDGKAESHGEEKQEGAPADGAGHAPEAAGHEGGPEDLLTSTPAPAERSMFSIGYLKSLVFGDEAAASEQKATAAPEHNQVAHNGPVSTDGETASSDHAPVPDAPPAVHGKTETPPATH